MHPKLILVLSFFIASYFLPAHNSLATEYYRYDMKQMKAFVSARQSVGRKIGNFALTDQNGTKFNLKDYIGSPFVVNFVYTNCLHTCSLNASVIESSVKEIEKDLGKKVNVITVGFDYERDTPERMREYGESFTKDFKYWRFATGDKKTIEGLTKHLGFYYKKTGEGFDHLNMISVIDIKGQVYKHIIYNDDKEIKKAQEGLIAAVEKLLSDSVGKKDFKNIGLLEKIKLLCSEYDPTTLQYKFSYYYFITKFVLGNILFFILPLIILWRREILSLINGCKGLIMKMFKAT